MDQAHYLSMFLAEAREHLQELNLAVVRLEAAPDVGGTIDEIFRIAHSLKGMSATMGFAALAKVTHEMEEVLEIVRKRRRVERAVIDVLLECLDALESSVAAIEAGEGERIDSERLVSRLRALVRGGTEAVDGPQLGGSEQAEDSTIVNTGRRVLYVRAVLVDDALMPGVRAFQVLEAVGDHGVLLRSVPDRRGIETFSGRTVEAWLQSEDPPELVERSARTVSDVASVSVEECAQDLGMVASGLSAQSEPQASAASVAQGPRTVRIDAERLDQLMHLMGEVVIHRTRVEALVAGADIPGLQQAIQDLTRSSQALQAMVMQVRMVPVEAVFLRFPRVVRDLAARLGKQVELVLAGEDTELDRTVVEALGDPLVHLVRNALDHGLESPEERVAAGKPPTGRIEIAARHVGGNVVVSVSDDGRGIDPALIARKAVERGLIQPEAADSVDAARAAELLFEPGFSTAEHASDLSGRGVGMDAVRTLVRGLGGEVVLRSQPGAGTTVQMRLPLTLAIMSALLVEVGGEPFAIPIDRVERTLQLREYPVRSVAGRQMLVLREGALPLLDAAASLCCEDGAGERPSAVIVRAGDQRLALAVDTLVGQRELVTRPLPAHVGTRAAVSGGAVLSNGAIALIVDCDALSRMGSPTHLSAHAA